VRTWNLSSSSSVGHPAATDTATAVFSSCRRSLQAAARFLPASASVR
jgi:hypothetical protein